MKRFHPWVFSGAIARINGNPEEGEVVEIYTSQREFIAKGHWQIGSIAVRVLTFRQDEAIDADFWRRRLQTAYDHFSRDDDGLGKERGKLVQDIRRTLERRDAKHQARWDKLWADAGANRLRRADHDDFWVWNHDFYNADVPELRRIRLLLEV